MEDSYRIIFAEVEVVLICFNCINWQKRMCILYTDIRTNYSITNVKLFIQGNKVNCVFIFLLGMA